MKAKLFGGPLDGAEIDDRRENFSMEDLLIPTLVEEAPACGVALRFCTYTYGRCRPGTGLVEYEYKETR